MKKRLCALLSCVFLFTAMLGAMPSQAETGARESGKPMLSGMFIAPTLTGREDAWTQDDWNTAMEQMKGIGVDQVVVQYAVYFYSEYNKAYFYTPAFETAETGTEAQRQQLPFILQAAKAAGVQVWLGLSLYEDAWFSGITSAFNDVDSAGRSQFLTESEQYAERVFDDLWSQFQGEYGDTIAGWYLPFEFNNENLTQGNGGIDRLINDYYAPLTAHIKAVTPAKPTMCSPLVYTPLKGEADPAKLENWKTLLQSIWTNSRMDIIAPQDGCGWESSTKETIVPWYQAMAEAKQAAQPARDSKGWGEAVAWNNPEVYSMNPMGVMTTKRFTDNMAAIDQYVDAHVSFSLHSFVHLDQAKSGTSTVNEAFYKAYRYYYENGALYVPSTPIPTPANAQAAVNGFGVTVTFDRVDVGEDQPIAGYELWRKEADAGDAELVRIQEVQQAAPGESLAISDAQLEPGRSYEYRLYAVDGTGNRSGEPAVLKVEIPSYGIALNREFGDSLGSSVAVTAGDFLNGEASGDAAGLTAGTGSFAFALTDRNTIGKYTLTCDLGGEKTVGFAYLQLQNNPFVGSEVFLPEKIDVLADGKSIAVVYPYKEYGSSATGGVWIPIDFGEAVTARQIQLVVTQKYANSEISVLRIYEASATSAATPDYLEPVNLVEGQPVYFNTSSMQNFTPADHLFGIVNNTIDMLTGQFTSETLTYKSAPATSLLTHGLSRGPSVAWSEDGNNTAWLRVQNMGGEFVMEVDIPSPSILQAVEMQWLLDRDSAVFLPSYIEVYGTTAQGAEELIGTAYRPSEVMIDFDKEVSADNTHRVETVAFRVPVESNKLYKKISLRISPQYANNAHFIKSVAVY